MFTRNYQKHKQRKNFLRTFIFSRRGSSGSTGSSNPGEGTPIKPLAATPKPQQPATPNPPKSTKKQVPSLFIFFNQGVRGSYPIFMCNY